jgi:hypothetical protein
MGVYDTFHSSEDEMGIRTSVQVKFTNDGESMPLYGVGDRIPFPIEECVIIGYEGYVVISKGIVQQVGLTIYDKWGGLYEPNHIIDSSNPIAKVIDELNLTDMEETPPEEMKKLIELDDE